MFPNKLERRDFVEEPLLVDLTGNDRSSWPGLELLSWSVRETFQTAFLSKFLEAGRCRNNAWRVS